MMKCDHYAVITLSVDNKITLRLWHSDTRQKKEREEKWNLLFDNTDQLWFDGTHHHNKI